MNTLKHYWEKRPLVSLLFIAFFFRLISVVFSKGYGMADDHFLVIEAAQSFVDGYDYNNWLPWNQKNPQPDGHSFFYLGIHYVLLWVFKNVLFLDDPQTKMYILRFLHALYSLITVYLGFRITRLFASLNSAKQVGLLLSVLWFIPILSVRNLVEVTCIPPLMATTWYILKYEKANKTKFLLLAGLMIGIAMGIRFQTAFFAAGFGSVFLIRKQWKAAFVFGVSGLFVFFLTQASDLFIWKQPMAEFTEYVRYNFENKITYFNRPWYMYLGTLAGLLVPPVSLFLFWGYGKMFVKMLVITLPSLIFFVFHSYFPNKQERFILPFIPFLIMAGVIGWQSFVTNSTFWANRTVLNRNAWKFFWTLNAILLLFVTPAYTKRSLVESMTWLSKQADFNNFVVESSHSDGYKQPPLFYAKTWKSYYFTTTKNTADNLFSHPSVHLAENKPNYVVFLEEEDVEGRIRRFETGFRCKLVEVAIIQPSYIDALLHWLNPNNENYTARIYKIIENPKAESRLLQ